MLDQLMQLLGDALALPRTYPKTHFRHKNLQHDADNERPTVDQINERLSSRMVAHLNDNNSPVQANSITHFQRDCPIT